jgi:nitrogen regulatory protein PII
MHYMVILVLDDVNQCPAVFDAWEAVGVTGLTIIESTGLGRLRRSKGLRDDMPLMPSIRSLLQSQEERHRTVFSIVEGDAMIDALIEATESAIGKLSEPHTGVLFAVPVARVVGLPSDEEMAGRAAKRQDR